MRRSRSDMGFYFHFLRIYTDLCSFWYFDAGLGPGQAGRANEKRYVAGMQVTSTWY